MTAPSFSRASFWAWPGPRRWTRDPAQSWRIDSLLLDNLGPGSRAKQENCLFYLLTQSVLD